MPSRQQMEDLREKARSLALEHQPPEESQDVLNGMLAELNLAPSRQPPEELVGELFDSQELAQHLENLTMDGVPFPHPSKIDSLTSLRNALLL